MRPSAMLSSMMVISEQVQSPLWLPAAIGVAAAIWLGWRAVPALFIAAGYIGSALARRQGLDLEPMLMVSLGTAVGGTVGDAVAVSQVCDVVLQSGTHTNPVTQPHQWWFEWPV